MHEAFTPTVFQRHHNQLRAVLIDRQPWFVARDVAHLLSHEVIPTLHDQPGTHGNPPRRVLMVWHNTRIGLLDWQGELWVPLHQLPTFSPWQEPPAPKRWFG